jgi:hypothetical protein
MTSTSGAPTFLKMKHFLASVQDFASQETSLGVTVIKLFFFVNDKENKYPRAFVLDKPLQPAFQKSA